MNATVSTNLLTPRGTIWLHFTILRPIISFPGVAPPATNLYKLSHIKLRLILRLSTTLLLLIQNNECWIDGLDPNFSYTQLIAPSQSLGNGNYLRL